VLARATLNGLAGRVVASGPPVAHPWCTPYFNHYATLVLYYLLTIAVV